MNHYNEINKMVIVINNDINNNININNDINNLNENIEINKNFLNFITIENDNGINNIDDNLLFKVNNIINNYIYENYFTTNIFIQKNYYKKQIDNIYFYEKIYLYYHLIYSLIYFAFFSYSIYENINRYTSILIVIFNIIEFSNIFISFKNLFKIKIPENTPESINNFTNIYHLKIIILYNGFIHSIVFGKIIRLCWLIILYSFLCIVYNNYICFLYFHIANTFLSALYIFLIIVYVIRKY